MELSRKWISGVAVVVALMGSFGLRAESELDGVSKAPAFIVSKLDTSTQTITNYKLEQLPESLSNKALAGLSAQQRVARIQAFLGAAATEQNKISEEKAVAESSELDKDGSTGAHWRRWRRWHGGYYGHGYYYRNYYRGGYRSHYYRPYWGWNYNRGYYDCNNYYPTYYRNYSNLDVYYTVYGW